MLPFLPTPALLLLGASSLVGAGAWILIANSRTVGATEREKRRRLKVHHRARTCEGLVLDSSETLVHYRYAVHGVEFDTSQDVSSLRSLLPAETRRWIGPVNVKYEPNNPGNSIVVCEEWSGFTRIGDANR